MALSRNTASKGSWSSGTSFSFSHDSGSGDRRYVWVGVTTYDTMEDVTATATYAGEAMTSVSASWVYNYAGPINVRVQWFYKLTTYTGAQTVAVTLSSAPNSAEGIAVTYADCGGPGANTNTTSGNLATHALTIATAAATNKVAMIIGTQALRTEASTDGTTIETAPLSTGFRLWMGDDPATGGTDGISTVLNSTARSISAILEITEDTGGGGSSPSASPSASVSGSPSASVSSSPSASASIDLEAIGWILTANTAVSFTLTASQDLGWILTAAQDISYDMERM